ncbi:CDP-glycerol:poly(glycerophosphate) glycerophosphotransferase [Flavobacterium cutihirudinis]|uniref:CDP-glycerol:poly(Glycerophosphate) glycerophosphotransferase n=1 Tax=Flavobacterium cutihirudinis TaxID=1265740 RepID=A0A3D9FK99_9FLAO|nr:CDP-glycerol glycerophosphotransferase family protein [Flavobacterium cutihirudinis]RED19609.1 CDP-glycerol:poly(glycerophosphate) glycerophosphotransferase [Flavobacterium cutihirudinis]
MSALKSFIKKNIPPKILNGLIRLRELYLIKDAPRKHRKALEIVRRKDKLKVVFFLIHDSVWKYDYLYNLMLNDNRYDPLVVVCPYMIYGDKNMIFEMNKNFENFKEKGYVVIKSFDEKTGEWMDVKNEIKPDLVFFTNPHKLTKEIYYIDNFLDTLTCYVPYSFQVSNLYKDQFDQPFHSKIWKQFYETEKHKQIGKKYSFIKGANIVVTGYPGIDSYLENAIKASPWPSSGDKKLKKIIWAPHHTIPGDDSGLGYSSFFELASIMINIAKTYSDKIQIAFKPHPILKSKLYKNESWGKSKTDDYFKVWGTLQNTFIVDSGYSELFQYSDALIHDSGSFTAEYLLLNKPVMFTVKSIDVLCNFNDFGKECLKMHYLGFNDIEIKKFIDNVVIGEKDFMKSEREEFVNQNCLPPNNKTASQNILDYINKEIVNK